MSVAWLTGAARSPSCLPCLHPGVSFPLIRLTQFTQYLVAVRVSGLPPVELSVCFSGASGHSQGHVMAVAIFSSKDDVSFLENVQKALKCSFSLACGVSSSHLSLRFPLMGERVNPCQCCPPTAYSSKTFKLTSLRRISISLITLKLAFRSTTVLATLSTRAHVPFMGSSPTYVRSAPQMASIKARSNSPSESRCSTCVSSLWPCHSTANIYGMLWTR